MKLASEQTRLEAAACAAASTQSPDEAAHEAAPAVTFIDSPCFRCGALHAPLDGCGMSADEDATYAAWEALPDDPAARLDTARHIVKNPDSYDPELVHVAEVALADLDEGAQPGLRIPDENAPGLADNAQAAVLAAREQGLPAQPTVAQATAAAEAEYLSTADEPPTEAPCPAPYYGWMAEHDPLGQTHAIACPTCDVPAGEPCRIEPGYAYLHKEPWPAGWVHNARAAHHEHAVWLAQLRSENAAAALLERCPHPDCLAEPNAPCAGSTSHDGRLCLALARKREHRAARDIARLVTDALHPHRDYSCAVCGAPGGESCRTRSGKSCMDHDEKRDTWFSARRWLEDAITAVEATLYRCTTCHDEGQGSCDCNKIPSRDSPAPESGYRSAPAVAARIAATPALAIECPECFAHVGQECRLNADGQYLSCRARKTALEIPATPSLFGAAPLPPIPKPADWNGPNQLASREASFAKSQTEQARRAAIPLPVLAGNNAATTPPARDQLALF